ncbi:MAG TPA: nucleotidyltransferase [Verrucomicrobiae bacterium]|jgi:hypothetical protein|nr:nucleotidyltransferase [Verrucomicrobiae bacterium]
MKANSFAAIVKALNAANVRFLVVGGLAVNAYGYSRFTHDVDIVIRLTKKDIFLLFSALKKIGYRPRSPITVEEFADPKIRKALIKDKNMLVLQMWSDEHRETPLDIFVQEPFIFATEYKSALVEQLDKEPVRIISLKTLIRLKKKAGRDQDRIDVANLAEIQKIKAR